MKRLFSLLVILGSLIIAEKEVSADGNRITILQINAENEFGQPTSVTTGNMTRTYSYDVYGMPVRRTMGTVMDCSYSFNHFNGNLISRTDNTRNQSEYFGYDELNRLTAINDRIISYSDNGNITRIEDVGELSYDNSLKPYQVTSLALEEDVIPSRVQSVSYTCYSRPSIMTEGGRSAAFTYNGEGERVKMNVSDGTASVLSRYYIGNQYELDVTPTGTTERLYLGGDAYSAPAVYIKDSSGAWTFCNIGRDYLGNITHIATANGTLIEENSYDPWGRLRNPETKEIYSLGTEPELMLGRGYTGHEHLTWFGIINMNARLYDPVLGRFLSPDPFVQMPDFTQNFNRYSYCLNNPLIFVDQSGEFVFTTMLIVGGICAAVFGAGNLTAHAIRGDALGQGNWAKYFFSGALAGFAVGCVGYAAFAGASAMASSSIGLVRGLGKTAAFGMKWLPTATTGLNFLGSAANGVFNQNDQWFNNFGKSVIGNFYLDENKSFGGQLWEGISRFTWEYPQQMLGYGWTSIRNIWSDRVDYFGGAMFVTNQGANIDQGVTIGNFINIDIKRSITGHFDDYILTDSMYMHEYGHKIDSSKYGLSYLFAIGIPSAITAIANKSIPGSPLYTHNNTIHEISANKNASKYFSKFGVNWSSLPDIYHPGFKAIDSFPLVKL